MKVIISNSAQDPIYQQVSGQIKEQIISGELGEGDSLPSIRKLARELQISVITTKRAYEELEKEGFIDTVGGKGCFWPVEVTRLSQFGSASDRLSTSSIGPSRNTSYRRPEG